MIHMKNPFTFNRMFSISIIRNSKKGFEPIEFQIEKLILSANLLNLTHESFDFNRKNSSHGLFTETSQNQNFRQCMCV